MPYKSENNTINQDARIHYRRYNPDLHLDTRTKIPNFIPNFNVESSNNTVTMKVLFSMLVVLLSATAASAAALPAPKNKPKCELDTCARENWRMCGTLKGSKQSIWFVCKDGCIKAM